MMIIISLAVGVLALCKHECMGRDNASIAWSWDGVVRSLGHKRIDS
jgi:hypothetical protein